MMGQQWSIYQFFEAHSKVKLTEDQLSKLSFERRKSC